MTKKEMFVEIRKVVEDNAEMVAFIDHELELLNKKSSGNRKPTKTQIENESLKADIIAYLAVADCGKTIREMQADVVSIANLSNQRVTHLLTDLVKAEKVTKTYIKRVPYFALAE